MKRTCPTCGQLYELPPSMAERFFPRSLFVRRLSEWFTRLTTRDLHE